MAYTTQFNWIQGTRRCNVWQCATYVGVKGQKHFCIENSPTCWSSLVCELQGPFYSTSMNFIPISGVGTVPNIKLDSHQSTTLWWIGKSFVRYPQEDIDHNCTKFQVNPMNQCGDIKYFNSKSATLWSSPKILASTLGAHGEVATWVSYHLATRMWRYATLPVCKEICRKLLFNNLNILWNI